MEPDQPSTAPMAARRASPLQLAMVVAIIAGYAVLSHYSNTVPDAKGLATWLSLAPLLLIGAVLVWRWSRPLLAASIFALAGILLVRYWPVLIAYYEWSDLVQQCGAYALLSLGFARSLFGGRVPLCTQLTAKLHGPPTPAEISYTRWATVAWAVVYALLAATIFILFFVTPLRVWSLFVNFYSFGIIGLTFVIDHAIRRRVLPHRPGGVLAALRQSLGGSN